MSVKSGQSVTVDFTTADPTTGAAADADALPTATLVVNGTDNAATVTVTNKATGVYKAAVTLPALSAGDVVSIRVAATVATVAGVGVVWTDVAEAPVALAADQPFYAPTTWRDLEGLATAGALAAVDTVVDGIAADYAKTGEAAAAITSIPASVDIRLSETHGGGSWESNQPTTGALVTPLSVGDDGLPLGRIMPYGTISVYLGAELHYRFDKIADAGGDFVLTLPYGATWTLVAENPPTYRSTTVVITIPPSP